MIQGNIINFNIICLIFLKRITVLDLVSDIEETLDFKERVINMSLAYNNLIVTS